ncbi:MAG: hypothetical protein HYT12_03360 [Candidatus Liptonbacteria bacterium]|nr:hypothetical protein [Candidatus Liptonbacteria bacterium]
MKFWRVVFVFSIVVTFSACGGGGGSGGDGGGRHTNEEVEWQVGNGTIGNILFNGVNLTGETPFVTLNGQHKKYKGGGYDIGSCDITDDNNNITTRNFGPFHALRAGTSERWRGTLETIDRSSSCLGPEYDWTLTNIDGFHLRSSTHIYNIRTPLISLSFPTDFSKDPTDEFRFSSRGYNMTVFGCEQEHINDFGFIFEGIPSECITPGADVKQGLAIKGAPISFFELRRLSLGIGFRRTVLNGSNYRSFMALNHPGDHTLQASWDRGDENRPLMPGEELFAEEMLEIFFLN